MCMRTRASLFIISKPNTDNAHDYSGEGDFDAAEIDKEIIATRLKQDVLEHSGKVHLFVADSVRSILSSTLLMSSESVPHRSLVSSTCPLHHPHLSEHGATDSA